jgi:superfamily II RNA helicase
MPARTTIISSLSKRTDVGHRVLTVNEFTQMTGRAGRRGMDTEGYVYVRINPRDMPFPTVQRIIYGKPEPIRSQLNTTYATLLNLYRDLGADLLNIYPQTFHHFQSPKQKREEGLDLIKRKLSMLHEMAYLDDKQLTEKGEFASSMFGYELFSAEMQADRVFESLNDTQLNILLSGLIYEPRKGDQLHPPRNFHKNLCHMTEHYTHLIYRHESKHQVQPYTKAPHFNLGPAVEAWTQGMPFDKLFALTTVDEGELVRHFRMVIQLLRELQHAPHASEKLRQTAARAREKINRDVVDAEKQLRA